MSGEQGMEHRWRVYWRNRVTGLSDYLEVWAESRKEAEDKTKTAFARWTGSYMLDPDKPPERLL